MIEPTPIPEKDAVSDPLWQRVAFFALRWAYRLTGGVIIVAAGIVLLAQTDVARAFMRSQILNLVNAQLMGKIACSEVRLDIFRGIVLEHPQLYAGGTTVIDAERLSATYDLAAFIGRTIAITELKLTRPKIYVVTGLDSVWNVAHIVKPPAYTTSSPPPNITVRLKNVSITDGHLVINDRTTAWGSGQIFDPKHLSLKSFELRAAARLALVEHDYSIAIHHLSFYDEIATMLDLRELTLATRITPQSVDIQSLTVRLAQTKLFARARLDGLDVLKGELSDSLLAIHPIVGTIEADRVWGPELRFFAPEVNLADAYVVRSDAVFSGKNVRFENIDLTAGDGHFLGSVDVSDWENPDQLGVDIKVHDSHARYADVRRRLLGVPLPELPFLDITTIKSVHLTGHPSDSLWFEVHARDQPGNVDGEMKLFLDEKRLRYEVDMSVQRGDLSVFADSTLATAINGRVLFHGKGVTLQDLEGTYQIELDRSVVAKRPIRKARLILHANGMGLLSVDTLLADLTPFRLDSIDEYALTPDDRLVGYRGTINTVDVDHPKYSGHVEFSAINLASLLNASALPTRFTGRVDVDAEGVEIDSLLGAMNAEIDEFTLDDRALMPFTLKSAIKKVGAIRTISVEAPFISAHIQGSFQLSTIIGAISGVVENTIDAVERRIRYFYPSSRYVEYVGTPIKPMEATFNIDLRDASPLNILLDNISLSASARVRGSIGCTNENMTLDIDTLDVADLLIQTDSTRVVSDQIHLSFTTQLANISTSPQLVELAVVGSIDSVLSVNSIHLKKPVINMSTRGDSVRVHARADINNISAGIGVVGQFYADSADLTIDSLHLIVDIARNLEWRFLRPAGVTLHKGNFRVRDLAVQRSNAEFVTVNGRFSLEEFDNLTVVVQNFNLTNITRFVDLEEGHPVRFVNGMIRELTAQLNGTWTQPVMDLAIDAVGVRYDGELIGTLVTLLHHEERNITGSVSISNPMLKTETKTLDLVITHLPIDLGLRDVKQRLVNERPIQINMRANKLALATIEPFLPAIERLQGVADGVISISGTTPDKIDLGGNARFKNASFLSSSTNIQYRADGSLHLEGSNLYLDTVIVRNVARDRKDGVAYADGVVVFDGLRVDSVDFNVRSKGVLVLNKSSQARSPKVFGDVVIATGVQPIHLFGKLGAPALEGDIHVLYADILFPKERSTTQSRYTAFEYNQARDTVRRYNSVFDKTRQQKITSDPSDTSATNDPVVEAIESVVKSTTAAFADILRYDLNIYLKGRTLMTMVMGFIEILIADLEQVDQQIPLVFQGRFVDNSTTLRGKLRVKEGSSTYKFYKPFLASGTLDFTLGGMTNPVLDLMAVYKGRRTLSSGKSEDFRVELAISGTKLKPIARWSVYRQDRKQEGDSAKITGDALCLILLGKTQDELVASGHSNLVGEVNASLSAVATSALGDLLGGIGSMVQSAQIDVGSDISQSRLTVSGQLFSDVSYRLSGQISDFSGNSTIAVTVPFTMLSNTEAMRYFMLDLSRSINNTGNITRFQRLWEIKLGARLP